MKIKRIAVEDDGKHPMAEATRAEVEDSIARTLAADQGPQPWCTCGQSGAYSFDQQLGIFVHVSEKVFCYKPSKAYYKAAVEAGIVIP